MITGNGTGEVIIKGFDKELNLLHHLIIGEHFKFTIYEFLIEEGTVRNSEASQSNIMGVDLVENLGSLCSMFSPHGLTAEARHNVFGQ